MERLGLAANLLEAFRVGESVENCVCLFRCRSFGRFFDVIRHASGFQPLTLIPKR